MNFKSALAILSLAVLGAFFSFNTALAAPPAKAFGELPVGFDAAISPNGSHIALIINVKGTYGVITKNADGETTDPWYFTLGKDIKPRFIKWVNDHRFVVAIAKSEEFRGTPYTVRYLFSGDYNTREGKFIVTPKKLFRQVNDHVVDWLEDDPEHILMAYSDDQFDPFPDIKKVNVETGDEDTVKRGLAGVEYWITDDDGTPRVGTGKTNNGKNRRIIYNSDTDDWESSDDYPGLDSDTRIYGVIKDGSELVVGNYNGKDTLGLYIYDLKQKTITRTVFHNENYDASGVILSRDGETIIGAKYVADSDKTELLSEYRTLLDRLGAKFNDYDIDFLDQTADGQTVVVKMSAPYDPGGVFVYSAKDDFPRQLTDMYNGFSSDDTGDVIAVKYPARDGEKIPGFMTLPPGTTSPKSLPFIVLPHGGPYARDFKRFDYFAQFFATRGYGVLQMNFRGSEGYGKSFAEAGRNNWVVMQQDVEDGTRWLFEKGYADQSRTCIAGWSYGGYAALMGVSTDPDLYKCAIAMAALTDINNAKRDLRRYRGGAEMAEKFFGESLQDKSARDANSPVNVADKIKVPVFLAHGDLDENVQFDQFTRMRRALKKADVDATFMTFENEDHFLSQQKNREQFFIGVEKFLVKVNGTSEYMK